MSSDKQEYYHNGEYVTIFAEVAGHPDMVVVSNSDGYGDFSVVRKESLVTKEESYEYKQALKRKAELEALTAKAKVDLDAVADKVVDKALIALSSRMKFNTLFGKDIGNSGSWAFMVMQELEKLVKDKGPEVVKKAENPFE